jgi:tetratricopeptide (TPR) repeat protein
LHDEARTLYENGEYRKAIDKLKSALELDPEAKELVYNLGLIHEKLLEFDTAESYYQKYLTMETDPKLIERAQTTLTRIEGAKKEVALREAAARARRKDSAAPTTPASQPKAAPPRRLSTWFWAASGAAAGGALVGTVFAITAVAGSPSSETRTGGGTTVDDLQDDADAAHTRAIIADVSFLVGGIAAGAAIYLYLTRPRAPGVTHPGARNAPAVQSFVGPRAGAVQVSF